MLLKRARALLRSEAVDRDLGDEMREHLAHLVEEHIARGMTLDAAREAARREFGPLTQIVEESRDARGVMWLANAWQDIKYGIRLMRRTPGFAAAAILTVAIGIGATTAMFSVVYGVVLQPLPYREPDRLVNLWSTAITRGLPRANVGMANVCDWRARNHVFEDIAALRAVANFNLTGQGEPERLNGSRVSSNLFPVLGVTPLVGRTFTEDEDEIGHEQVAILTYGLWVRRFGADPGIVGRTSACTCRCSFARQPHWRRSPSVSVSGRRSRRRAAASARPSRPSRAATPMRWCLRAYGTSSSSRRSPRRSGWSSAPHS